MKGIIDTSLRDGLQALWSSRLTADDIVPIAWTMDQAGFLAMDFMASVQFDVCIKHLREDPWKRIRAVRSIIRNTPLMTTIRGRFLNNFSLMPDEVVRLMIRRLAANGFRKIMILDSLHDIENIRFCAQEARAQGLGVVGILFYTLSPVHTDDRYVQIVSKMIDAGIDELVIRDPSGLLTPERTRHLTPMLREAAGSLPIYLKSHCNTGLAEECYLDALEGGVDAVFTAARPLANGPSVPDTESVVNRGLERGLTFFVDAHRLADIASYFDDLAARLDRPTGNRVSKPSAELYVHQVPGGMISFLKDQLRAMGLLDRFDEVLEEIPEVRKDFGYPVMVTPVSQLIAVQAALNVVHKERYKFIPTEVSQYVLGHLGKPEGELNSVLLDRVHSQKHSHARDAAAPGVLSRLRGQVGSGFSEDDILLFMLFQPDQLLTMLDKERSASDSMRFALQKLKRVGRS